MGIRYFIFAINKMDLVGYDQKRFEAIKKEIEALRDDLELENVVFIPVSATEGTTSPKSRNPWPGTMARPSSTTWKRSTSKKTTKKAFTFHSARLPSEPYLPRLPGPDRKRLFEGRRYDSDPAQ